MVYPAAFHRVVLIGTLYGDVFNTTISMIPVGGAMPASNQELADDVATAVGPWFQRALAGGAGPFGCGFIQQAKLTSVKVNRIGPDGRYVENETFEGFTVAPLPGASGATPPPQLSIAATLRGADERGLAGKGRMFLPPCGSVVSLDATGRISTTTAEQYGNGVAALTHILNDCYIAAGITSVAGIASNTRGGAFQAITSITVGRTVDTIRSRRNKILEDATEATAL